MIKLSITTPELMELTDSIIQSVMNEIPNDIQENLPSNYSNQPDKNKNNKSRYNRSFRETKRK